MSSTHRDLVIGLGYTGNSVVQYLSTQGRQVDVFDSRETPPFLELALSLNGVQRVDEQKVIDAGYDRAFLSPGVSQLQPMVVALRDKGVEITNDVVLFRQQCSAPVLAVTGSNGKSSVVSMVHHALVSSGVDAGLGGNIGKPVLEFLSQPKHACYVLELSSFQLELTGNQLQADVACVLNISEDHMDRYTGIAQYQQAKNNIYQQAQYCVANADEQVTWPKGKSADVFFSESRVGKNILGINARSVYLGDKNIAEFGALQQFGSHNQANALASLAILHMAGYSIPDMVQYIAQYQGLPHRFQQVANISGVLFINDSKATNTGAAISALKSCTPLCKGRIILIAGGDAKSANMHGFADEISKTVAMLLLIGRDAGQLAAAVDGRVTTQFFQSLEQAVNQAWEYSQENDIVILSPGCASLDMFTNFEERGTIFTNLVRAI